VAALAAGIRPPPPPSLLNGTSAANRSESYFNGSGGHSSSGGAATSGAGHGSPDPMDDEPLPPSAQPPTPGFGSRGGSTGKVQSFMSAGAALADYGGAGPPTLELNGSGAKENETLIAHRTVFFFKLEREMEKVCAGRRASRAAGWTPTHLPFARHRSTSFTSRRSGTSVCGSSRCCRTESASSPRSGQGTAPRPTSSSTTGQRPRSSGSNGKRSRRAGKCSSVIWASCR